MPWSPIGNVCDNLENLPTVWCHLTEACSGSLPIALESLRQSDDTVGKLSRLPYTLPIGDRFRQTILSTWQPAICSCFRQPR